MKVGPYQCDSLVEAAYIGYLISEREDEAMDVLQFLFHPKFHFQSGNTWEADALVFYEDGQVRVIDVKSRATLATASFKDKMKLMADEYPQFEVWIAERHGGTWMEYRYAPA